MLVEKTITNKYKWVIWAKTLVFVACVILIYLKLKNSEHFTDSFLIQLIELTSDSAYLIVIVLLLMPVNWLLEALKWRLLAKPKAMLSLSQSIKGVVSGLSLGFITPQGVGDYAGRLLSINADTKGKLVGSIWLGHAMQLMVTLIFGTYGLKIFLSHSSIELTMNYYWWMIIIVLLVIVVVWLYRSKVQLFGQRIHYYFSNIGAYKSSDYIQLFLLSAGRYFVFSLQFILILIMFEIPLPIDILFAGVSWMFLAKSIIPSFNFLSDLGVRELSVLTFFELYEVSHPAILFSSLLLWLINILIPVLIGLYFVMKLKIQSRR